MKFAAQCMLLLLFTGSLSAQTSASSFPSAIKHIVIIVQENRTPDNLFQALPSGKICMNGAAAPCYNIEPASQVPLAPVGLATNFDLSHTHTNFENEQSPTFTATPSCGTDVFGCAATTWNQFMFVSNNPVTNSDGSSGLLLDPYTTLATSFGWANQMFQTNQGPSYPAHQFLFSGTSALSASGDAASTFVSENFSLEPNGTGPVNSGCMAGPDAFSDVIQPIPSGITTCPQGCTCSNGAEECQVPNVLNGAVGTFCVPPFNPTTGVGHNSMATLLNNAGVSWKYYAPSAGSIWTAPNALEAICQPVLTNGDPTCSGFSPTGNVDVTNLGTDILTDIGNCKLGQVSWVIPDGRWSDHANANTGLGPSWVAAVANAIGTSGTSVSGTACSENYWQDTAIVITWDDWGGWFDHVGAHILTGNPGDYQYGFRVPLIVVSAYTPTGTINDSLHDFGSILRMIEGVFGLGEGSLGFADARANGDLHDFFATTLQTPTYTQIPAVKSANYFIKVGQSGALSVPPDDDE